MGELDYRFSQTIAYNKSIWNEEKGSYPTGKRKFGLYQKEVSY
jgi:hypothetical protein